MSFSLSKTISFQLLAISLFTAACGQKDPAAELAKLKQEQTDTQAKIAALETKGGAENPADTDKTTVQTVPVSVLKIAPESFKSYLEVQGRVDFDQNATVGARAAGTLTSLRVQRG
ncbi:MAG: efflux RND transporter periplasmic adaptor subunit, partial [Hymenobacter sp.]|nr:efflux RND transporter periplasmic adaptor subunit [Hymenobacter sp.]